MTNAAVQVDPMTKEEFVIRQTLAISVLNEPLVLSWVDHQPWCAFTQAGLDCTCGTAVDAWFAGPRRLVVVGFDMHPIAFEKH